MRAVLLPSCCTAGTSVSGRVSMMLNSVQPVLTGSAARMVTNAVGQSLVLQHRHHHNALPACSLRGWPQPSSIR